MNVILQEVAVSITVQILKVRLIVDAQVDIFLMLTKDHVQVTT